MTDPPSREVEIDPRHAALLIIDVQNYTARRDGGEYRDLTEQEIEERFGFFFRTFEETALPNLKRLQAACRRGRIEVLYTVIESLTRDGRDRHLHNPQPRAARMVVAQQPRLCPPAHHRRAGGRDRAAEDRVGKWSKTSAPGSAQPTGGLPRTRHMASRRFTRNSRAASP